MGKMNMEEDKLTHTQIKKGIALIVFFVLFRALITQVFDFESIQVSLESILILFIMFLVGSLGLVYVGFSRWVGVDLKKWWYNRQKLAGDIGWGVLGFIIVQILTLVIVVALFMLFFPPAEMLTPQTIPPSAGEILLMLFFGFAIASIQEETLFRGFLQNVLTERVGKWLGNVLQAAIFSIAHIGYFPLNVWPLFILAFLLGIVFGWLKIKRGTLIVPGIAHGLFG